MPLSVWFHDSKAIFASLQKACGPSSSIEGAVLDVLARLWHQPETTQVETTLSSLSISEPQPSDNTTLALYSSSSCGSNRVSYYTVSSDKAAVGGCIPFSSQVYGVQIVSLGSGCSVELSMFPDFGGFACSSDCGYSEASSECLAGFGGSGYGSFKVSGDDCRLPETAPDSVASSATSASTRMSSATSTTIAAWTSIASAFLSTARAPTTVSSRTSTSATSAQAAATSTEAAGGGGGLSKGEIAGIVVGALGGFFTLLGTIGTIWMCCRRRI
ncbi:hypothetical protein M409DRAFT_51865 [Zasmidium cellare ATCC 36951]|uniref:WSC domain-containing protein n=1 Tax=Zasmidium cellare ATCC 36951 TaxID=1080233 RepID=A0A6A6CSH1_ZASCE|nr:uncharacterized protein M409DRAFT_51865 [Zasmidium cellare ATCC 36951]KAF2170104.1 hypothetical protein M409DRAFT_51865 [Zasmidium cellare ATCC 36951]